MDLSLTDGQRGFLDEVRAFLQPFEGLDGYLVSEGRDVDTFYRALAERNWIAISWPTAFGGEGRPVLEEFLLWNEVARRRIARPPQGAGVVAKTIMRYGSAEQQAHWLPRIRRHDATFALAYSEPEAGSDLASLRCTARRVGESYALDGNKCWNSRAHLADYLWLLGRTGAQADKGRALSLFIVAADSPGVTIRPIRLMDGNVFTEIFLDHVDVPLSCRVGDENQAWPMMAESLADERHIHFLPGRVVADYEDVRAFVEARPSCDQAAHAFLVDAALDALEAQLLALRVLDATIHNRRARFEVAQNKLAHVRAIQALAQGGLAHGGAAAAVDPRMSLLWRQTTTESIGGGTTEIMQSIVARERLGLRADR